MHEASIAMSILEIAEDHCRKAGYSAIRVVEVKVGSASGIMPDALYMAFDIVKLDTIANDAKLTIIEIPLGGTCRGCENAFQTDEPFILACPNCGGKDFALDTGRELDISEIEVE